MKPNIIFAAIIIASLSFIACDTNNATSGATCTVTYDATSLRVYQNIPGKASYEVEGVYSSKLNFIYNDYKATYFINEDASSNCKKMQDQSWYSNVVCSGNTITYEDLNETSIEREALDFQEMCDDFFAHY